MIGSERFTTAFASGADLDDPEQFRRSMMKAAGPDLGFALVFLHPGTKDRFICPLTARTAKKADEDERERTGNPRATHPCGRYHVFTDSASVGGFLRKRIDAGQEMPNVAVELGASRMMVVDLDTEAEVEAWEQSWPGYPDTPAPPLTVHSPGKVDRRGEWVHKNGGHLWLDLTAFPDTEGVDQLVGSGDGTVKHGSGWTLYYRDRIVLVPPSQRPEGRYEFMAAAMPADRAPFLLSMIADDARARVTRAHEREQRRAQAADRDSSGMIEWAAHTSWDEQLVPAGWTNTGKPDSCGCTIYTAPGDHGSPKSATAHGDGCSYGYDADEGHLPLHVWTDNPPAYLPPDQKTFTLFQHNAWLNYKGDMSAAAAKTGVVSSNLALVPLDEPPAPVPVPASALGSLDAPQPAPGPGLQAVTEDNASDLAATDAAAKQQSTRDWYLANRVEQLRINQQAAEILAAEQAEPFRKLSAAEFLASEPPQYLVPKMLPLDGLSTVFGPPGAAKSFLMLDIALSLATGRPWRGYKLDRTRVHYVMAEGRAVNNLRTQAWLLHNEVDPSELDDWFDVIDRPILLTDTGTRPYLPVIAEDMPGLIVLDTKNLMFEGKESAGEDGGAMLRVLHRMRREAKGAAVVLVDHTGLFDETRARGGNAQKAGLETEIQVLTDENGIRTATVTRDKSGVADPAPSWSYRLHAVPGVFAPPDVMTPAVCVPVDALEVPNTAVGPQIDEQWNDETAWPLPDDVRAMTQTGRGKAAIAHVALYMRHFADSEHGAGVTRAQLTSGLKTLRRPDGKPVYREDSVIRLAWDRLLVTETGEGRIEPISSNKAGASQWVSKINDLGRKSPDSDAEK